MKKKAKHKIAIKDTKYNNVPLKRSINISKSFEILNRNVFTKLMMIKQSRGILSNNIVY